MDPGPSNREAPDAIEDVGRLDGAALFAEASILVRKLAAEKLLVFCEVVTVPFSKQVDTSTRPSRRGLLNR